MLYLYTYPFILRHYWGRVGILYCRRTKARAGNTDTDCRMGLYAGNRKRCKNNYQIINIWAALDRNKGISYCRRTDIRLDKLHGRHVGQDQKGAPRTTNRNKETNI